MIIVSDSVKSAFKADEFHGNVTFTIDTNTYTAENILANSTTITESIASSKDIDFSATEKGCLKTTLINIEDDIKELKGETLTMKQTVLNTDIPLGVYTIVDAVNDGDYLYDITAYDNLHKFDVDVSDWWNTEVTFPISLRDLLISLCTKVGVSYNFPATFTNSTFQVQQTIYVESTTGLDFLGYIQEACAGFIKPDRTGVMKLVQLTYPNPNVLYPSESLYPSTTLYPTSIYSAESAVPCITYNVPLTMTTLELADYTVQKATKLQIRSTKDDVGVVVGTGDNTYVIESNPLFYSFTGVPDDELVASEILEVLEQISYIPVKTKVKAQPYIEVGDLVNFVSYEGKECYAPVLKRTLGGFLINSDTIEINGTETRNNNVQSVNKTTKILNRRIHEVINTVDEFSSTINEVSTDLSDLEKRTTENESQIKQTPTDIMTQVTETLTGYVTSETLGTTLDQRATEIVASVWSSEQGQQIINALLTLNQYGLTVNISDGASRLNGEGLLVLKQVGNQYYVVAKFTKEDSYTNNLVIGTFASFGSHRWESISGEEWDGVTTMGTGAAWTGAQTELIEEIEE